MTYQIEERRVRLRGNEWTRLREPPNRDPSQISSRAGSAKKQVKSFSALHFNPGAEPCLGEVTIYSRSA